MQRFAGIIGSFPDGETALRGALGSALRTSQEEVQLHTFAGQQVRVGMVGAPKDVSQLWSENRDIYLCWQGELFPGANEFPAFSRKHHNSVELGSWILSLYEKEGPESLEKLNGWFSGLIVDIRNQTALLFNDRYGLGRVYLYEKEGSFIFASEAKVLLALVPQLRSLDSQGLAEWFSCGCALQGRTLFKDLKLLPPASIWNFRYGRRQECGVYFAIEAWSQQAKLSSRDYEDKLRETFSSILQRYLPGDRSIAMSLTGGLDGRMIMAWARVPPNELPCYSFNGPYRECADVSLAKKIASACQQTHQTIPITPDFFQEFSSLSEEAILASDGAMDVTGAAEIFMNRTAAQVAPIRLTGNYGSEILRQHIAFRPSAGQSAFLSSDLLPQTEAAAAAYRSERGSDALKFIVSAQLPWHHYSRFAVEQSQLRIRSPYLDNDLVKLAFQAPVEGATGMEPSLRLIAAGNPALGRIPTDRGITWPTRRWENQLIARYHEFWAKAEYAYDYGMPQWLARINHALTPLHLERIFLGRQKFCHFRAWYQKELSIFVQDTLLSTAALNRWYVHPNRVKKAIESHIKGSGNFTTLIHKLLSLEILHRTLLAR